jgi:AhpD family alkylhydroperoxidase
MDWKAHLQDQSETLTKFREVQPGAANGFTTMHRAAITDGVLDKKTKELLALAIGISQRCVDCIGFHIQGAVKQGATRDEIAETISVAIIMGGGPAYMYGVKALDAYDQLIA